MGEKKPELTWADVDGLRADADAIDDSYRAMDFPPSLNALDADRLRDLADRIAAVLAVYTWDDVEALREAARIIFQVSEEFTEDGPHHELRSIADRIEARLPPRAP